jgi:hemerythrin-like domain-containing protein
MKPVLDPQATSSERSHPTAVRKHDQHPLLESTTLAGAAVGAAVGAMAGPPGAIVGGVIGLGVGLAAGEVLEDKVDSSLRAGALLRRDHAQLVKTYDALLAAYRSDDWNQVRAQWAVFETAIRAHMDKEEREVFPEFRGANPEEAEALLAEHVELRGLLGTLGVAMDLHAVPERDVQELVARIRAHGAREEAVLYPWMDDALDVTRPRAR